MGDGGWVSRRCRRSCRSLSQRVGTLTTTTTNIEHTISKLEGDIGVKVFFAGNEDGSYDPRSLRVKKLLWHPPLPLTEIDTRINHFTTAISTCFQAKQSTSNQTPFQQKLLSSIKTNANIVITAADKNLGPVGINKEQYITWGLSHHRDTPPTLG